jgi:hypothetical protein
VSTIFDRTAPSVASFTTPLTSPTNANPLTYNLLFSEPVTGLTAGDFTVTGCGTQVPTVTQMDSLYYRVSLSGCANAATVGISINSNLVADLAGNTGVSATTAAPNLTTDYVQPTIVSFTTAHHSTTNANPLVYSLVFSETVSGLTSTDFAITGCSSTPALTTSNNITFTISLSGCNTAATVVAALNGNSVSDTAGNLGPITPSNSISLLTDYVAPTLSWGSAPPSPTRVSSTYTIGFSEWVSSISHSMFTNSGTATGCNFTVNAIVLNYQYSVVADSCSDGTLAPTLNVNMVTDAGTNNPSNVSATGVTVIVDHTAPTATFIANPAARTHGTLTYTLRFDEAINTTVGNTAALSNSDFTYSGTATSCQISIAAVPSTNDYTVTVTNCTDGTFILLLNDDAVTDVAGNTGQLGIIAAGSTIDSTPATATITTVQTSPTSSAFITYTIVFNESVTGLSGDSNDFTLGGASCAFGPLTGSGTTYSLRVNNCADGASSTLTLKANAVQDRSLVAGVGNLGPAAVVNSSVATLIDYSPATVTYTTPATTDNDGVISIVATFNEAVMNVDAADFTNVGTASVGAISMTQQSSTRFTLTTAALTNGNIKLSLTGSITDIAGNVSPGISAASFDSSAATVVVTGLAGGFSTSPASVVRANPEYVLTFVRPVTGLTISDFTVRAGSQCVPAITVVSTTVYNVTLNDCVDGNVTLELNAGAVTDTYALTNTIKTATATVLDTTAPTATVVLRNG